jgi:hypothetical protein
MDPDFFRVALGAILEFTRQSVIVRSPLNAASATLVALGKRFPFDASVSPDNIFLRAPRNPATEKPAR